MLRFLLKTLLWVCALVAFLLLLVCLVLYVPAVQGFVKDKAVAFLKKKTNTEIRIESIHLKFPKSIELKGFYVEDLKKDTLLYAGKLKVNIGMLQLLNNKIDVQHASLENLTAHVYRKLPDTAFNFAFITKAFSSADTAKKETDTSESTPLTFSLGKIELKNIYLTYDDDVTGNDALLYLGKLETTIKDFYLENPTYRIGKIQLENVSGHLFQRKGLEATKATENVKEDNTPMPETGLEKIALSNINLLYKDDVSGLASALKVGDLTADFKEIDLQKQVVSIRDIALNNASAIVSLDKVDSTETKKPDKPETSTATNWQVGINKLSVKNTALKYDNNPVKPVTQGMDFNHLQVTGLLIDVDDIQYSSNAISAAINNISFNEKSGIRLQRLSANAMYDNQHAALHNFKLVTNYTQIDNSLEVSYPSIEAVSKDIGLLGVNADIRNLKLGIRDVLYFQPQLAANPDFKKIIDQVIVIKGSVKGKVSDLTVRDFLLNAGTQTQLSLNANIKGMPKATKGVFDIDLKQFTTSKSDIDRLVPAHYISSSVRIPDKLSLSGDFKGSMENFKTHLQLLTTSGNAKLNALMLNGKAEGAERYTAHVVLDHLNVGQLLKNEETLGSISLEASLVGIGTTVNTADTQLKGIIKSAGLKGYDYRNLDLEASFRNKELQAQAQIADPNVSFNFRGLVSLQQKYPAIKLSGIIDSINLTALNLSDKNIKFRGEINADLPSADVDYLNGRVDLFNFLVLKEKQSFPIDSIQLVAKSTADSNRIDLQSPIITATLKGKYQLSKLGDAIDQIVSKYINQSSTVEAQKGKTEPQIAELNAVLVYPKFLKELLPSLSRFQTGYIKANLNSQQGQLSVNANFPMITYSNIAIDSLKLNIKTDSAKLSYNLSLEQLTHPEITIHATQISGDAKNNMATINLSVKDDKDKEKYFMEVQLKALKSKYEFVLGKKLLLNYENWQVSEDNKINYAPTSLIVNKLKIAQNEESLTIDSQEGTAGTPLTVTFNQFNLETLSKIAEQDSAAVSGVLNGNALIENVMSSPVFVADLKVETFRFKSSKVGDITIKVNNKQANAYVANVSITGEGNDVQLDGTYFTQPQSSFDLNLAINKLNMSSVESFTFGQLRNATGTINGNLLVKGTVDQPDVNGSVTFNRTGFILSYLNSYFTLRNERIQFDDQGIKFDQFTISDSARNDAVIDGYVYTRTFRDYKFGLHVTTDNFRALNTKQNNNDLYYGPVYIDSDIKITGTIDQPKVDVNAKLREKSILTVVLPTGTPSVVDREGVIEFVDMDLIRKGIYLTYEDPDTTVARTTFKGFELSANIEVDKDAELVLIIDQQSGDNLRVKGTALMNATMDLSGKLSLTGTYQISEGAYNLSISGIVRRKFDIKEGSSITWTGEPTSANVDITAVYKTETSAMELFESQVASGTAEDKNKYKQKLPFEVELYIKNELMHPEISFALDIPEEERTRYAISTNVYNRIKQINLDESELNKQVLGLLVMNRFIASNPFSSLEGGGSGVEGIARQSASKLLSQQLNNLAGDLIKGVDLTFDLQSEEDYSSGQLENRTDLNVGVSKQLFGGRTTVYVGSNFELEGEEVSNRKTTNIAGDVSIEYLISRDGRYKLRAYRKDEYESIIEGQVIETGLSFILTMDYDKFKELFQKSKDKSKKKGKRSGRKRNEATEIKSDTLKSRQSNSGGNN
ncbi:translocation/assembly module TamB domain-containing protein [Solitalea canadensis]|uniref:Translocation and assembly module TamB C-terminal domain-containing protein n=1 Tax=Solitalea canadensis (strain ATCC 29591 / DSM 3403 / JCM 21819 / LMG 8368 / NBRC 15130 / NCIMB 12057 / USAM 9D) TaxID=929556 RepID=H8KQ14_SOLCM|nr:translocation/assembly module TamB [Solitalea canadensis]AFD06182.1 hypothetical protein Solca_1076 [Solitalea canadensis DSM 3403]